MIGETKSAILILILIVEGPSNQKSGVGPLFLLASREMNFNVSREGERQERGMRDKIMGSTRSCVRHFDSGVQARLRLTRKRGGAKD